MDCPKCGSRNPQRAKFCQACGAALTSATVAPPVGSVDPTAAPGIDDTWTMAARPMAGLRQWAFTPERFVAGDWLGAIFASLVALVIMAALAAAAMGIAGYDAEASTWFKKMLAFVVLSVGGSVHMPQDPPTGGSAGLSVMPLTFTLAGFGSLGWITSRRLKRSPHTRVDFLLQALRVIIVLALLLVIVGFVARHSQAGSSDYVHVKVAYSAFFGACVALAALGVTYFVGFGSTLPERAKIWRDRLVGPAVGVFQLVAVAVLLGTVYALVQILAVPHHLSQITQAGLLTDVTSRRDELSALLGFAPNHALWMLMWGMGVPLTVAAGHASYSWTLTSFTDGDTNFVNDANGVYWVLPVITGIVWLVAAASAALHAPAPRQGRRNGYRIVFLAPLLTSAIFVMAGLAERSGQFSVRMHFSYWWAFLLGLVWSASAGILAPELVLRLPPAVIVGLRGFLIRVFRAPPASRPDLDA